MIAQFFSKYDNAIISATLSGADTFGSTAGFAFSQSTTCGFGYVDSNSINLTKKGRYLILVDATLTNASVTNNQNTGFTIYEANGPTSIETKYASRPGTDAVVSIQVSGHTYIDLPDDNTKTVKIIAFSGTASDQINALTGRITIIRINQRAS